MNYVLIVIVYASLLTCVSSVQPRLCLENITTYVDVAKTMTRTKLVSTSWYSPAQVKSEIYQTIEKIPKIKQKHVCCDGYQMDEGECIPICSGGCPKEAKCIEPETCKCRDGYRMDDGICHLECVNCENGQCTDSGECECNAHYVRIDNRCKPICRYKCLNGFCAAPDQCECNSGYQMTDEPGRCEPVCGETCGGNAYCSAPDTCTCKYGFFGNASDVCQPWCKAECKNGDCVGPNNCACHQGFIKVDGLCIPDCHLGCQFGDCLDEGICRCWPGFLYNNATGSCQESLDSNTTTIVTTEIAYEPRFLKFELPTEERSITIPKQHEEKTTEFYAQRTTSVVGTTSSYRSITIPKQHEEKTIESYTRDTNSVVGTTAGYRKCADGTCSCREGFVEVDVSCAQLCANCKLGQCVEAKICGVQSTTESSSTSSESSTDIASTTTTEEIPSNCKNGCWAGTCVDGVCQCREGLILNDENDCIMPCEATCKNGVCNQENICECRAGYVYKNGSECVPHCDKECVNGFCIAPNHCECLEGYIANLSPILRHICLPTCDGMDGEEGCVNGTCVAVNKCRCFDGFTHRPGNRFECIPVTLQMTEERKRSTGFWYLYILLGLLILLIAGILGLFAVRKMYQDSYNVAKVEKQHGTVRYKNDEQPYCYI